MDSMYIKALETRAKWLRWAIDQTSSFTVPYAPEMRSYTQALEAGDTFFMNKKFCSLVECARETVPDDLIFDSQWMQARSGWLWIEEPFAVPLPAANIDDFKERVDKGIKALDKHGVGLTKEQLSGIDKDIKHPIRISAIGWYNIPEGIHVGKGKKDELFRVTGPGAYHFMCYQAIGDEFGTWSYFTLQDGDKLIDRVRAFEAFAEEDSGAYEKGRISDMMHEIRWVYAAFYLMAQRLAMNVQHNTDRHTRRRGERDKLPVTPFIRVVTLRRLEEARAKSNNPSSVEFNWQWEVRGHWRNQYFPSENVHKPVWIEAYIKGPEDKPFKSPGHKLFVAQR